MSHAGLIRVGPAVLGDGVAPTCLVTVFGLDETGASGTVPRISAESRGSRPGSASSSSRDQSGRLPRVEWRTHDQG